MTTAEARGFHIKDDATKQHLQRAREGFQAGFAAAVETGDPAATARHIAGVALPLHGFAYEGGAMGLAIVDVLSIGRHDRFARFVDGHAQQFANNAHVGLGWALARAPRVRWGCVRAPDPILRWRVLDGYGFHQAFFKTDRWVREQYQEPNFPWPDARYPTYANRAIDQGVGRAIWFVAGADVDRTLALINEFAPSRHGDLFAGAGLAATYAGGADESELLALRKSAGVHRPYLAQGAALAARTRVKANLVEDDTRVAVGLLCDTTPEAAAALTDEALVDLPEDGYVPAFEVWRQRIARQFDDS